MTEDLQFIQRFVRLLVRRERLLLVARVGLQAMLLTAAVLLIAVAAAASGWGLSRTTFLLVLGTGIGGWFAVAMPLLREWARAGDVLAQARRVEALTPTLRGRLLTAVERTGGAVAQESPAMVALVARRAAEAVRQVEVAAVHPSRQVARLLGLVALSYALVLPMTLGVLPWWAAGTVAEGAATRVALPSRQDFATVGDLTVRYVYPAYTGLDPRTVPNSTGDVKGPPGTMVEITARSADVVEAAGLVAYDERLEATVDVEGRQVTGRFSIGEAEGAYHLLLYRGASEPERSRDFAIEPAPDLPPEVMLETEADPIQVPADAPVVLQWRARDDHGISRVILQVAGEARPDPLFVAERRQAEVVGVVRTTPRQMGLKPGDSVELTVVAWDNDTVGGRKPGYSRPVTLVVLGARGLEARIAAREGELLELLVPILAAQLTDPWPPGDTSDAMARWGEVVSQRYEPLHDAVDRLWRGMASDTTDAALIRTVVDTGSKLVRYTQVAFAPGSKEAPTDEAYTATAQMRDKSITALEDAVLFLLDMQRARALAEAAKSAQDLANASRSLKELLEADEPDVQGMLTMLDQLERMMARLAEQAQKLGEGGLQEFINQRQPETQRLMDEIREALARGDIERARELMDRLNRQIEEMAQGMQDELERRNRQGEDVVADLEAVQQALEEIERDQRQVQSEVQELRERADQQGSREAAAIWERVERLSAEVVDDGTAYERAVEGGEGAPSGPFSFNEQQRARAALEDVQSLYEAAVARDLRGAARAVIEADNGWLYTLRAAEVRAGRGGGGPAPRQVEQIRRKLAEISRLLDQLDQASQQMDPSSRDRAEQLDQRQRELDRRLEEATRQARQLEQKLPVRPEGMQESLEEARQRMQQASGDLGQGQLMQAEGSQGSAAERVREARESLEQAKQQMQEQARQMQQQGQEGNEPRDDDGESGRDHQPFSTIEIPGREEFRTPEEYRRALLEGMEGEVPEEYRALKKRYFEELVHQ